MSRMTQGERDSSPKQSRSASVGGQSGDRAGGRPGEQRYQRGTRRTGAEPLEASWKPRAGTAGKPGKSQRPKGFRGFLAAYGWRVYALPVLLAVTALVVVQTAGEKSPAQPLADGASQAVGTTGDGEPSEPEATENPPGPADVNVPSAELPPGGAFTQTGAITWHGLPGSGPKIGGAAKLYTYTVEVEDGIDPSSFGGEDTFSKLVDQTLADPRGWTGGGQISVQRVEPDFPNPSFRISLTTPDTAHRPDMCGYSIKYESSCYRRSEDRVMINLARWVRGAVAFEGDMGTYRQYAINHEVGHAFNNGHVGCAEEGALAPVMMQQSFGVANNYVAQLNGAAGNREPIPQDGKTCKVNAWPNPQAKPPA